MKVDHKRSYLPALVVFFLYSCGFTLVVPVIPKLLDQLMLHDAAAASMQYGVLTA